MGLLHWCTVSPEGQSSLAAIRFTAPVRISSICIFPSGAQPFANAPEVVAQTEPEAFFLEVFLNAHPIAQADGKDKPRVANALVPTVIAYPGGQVDFTVDMGTDYATRLMIVKGKFDMLSMAIYGDIVTDITPPAEKYEARPLPSVDPIPLSTAVDPSHASDPTILAKQLLAMIPDSPPLPLVVRLMFCLKPSNDDWDLPEFPYLHTDLEARSDEELTLEIAIEMLSKPVRDDALDEDLVTFAARLSTCISAPQNSDQAYQIAKLLSMSASQHPGVARALLHHLDFGSLFAAQNMDEEILICLLDAATNVDVARHMNTPEFLDNLQQLQDNSRTDNLSQLAARRLSSRIRDWQCFEDALSNTRGDFNQSWNMLKEVGAEEQMMGIWLESMILHEDIVTKLAENAVLAALQCHSPLHFRNKMNIPSHDAFIALVRAFIGVASVLAVFAWADSLGNDVCREQTLAVLHLWQGVDGYREIVNHLMLLRQLTRRLEWITSDNDPPRRSGILAEKVIFDLAKAPLAILNEDLVQTILSLKAPLSFIAENELLSMRKVALVSEDGLPAAVEELVFSSDHPLSLRRLRTLRVSLAIIERELDDPKGEWRTLEAFWEERSPGIIACLIDILVGVSGDLNGHFVLSPPPCMNQAVADQLFLTADDLLRLITLLAPAFLLTARAMRRLAIAAANIFACTDAADMVYSQTSRACMAARGTRQACLDLVCALSGPDVVAEPGRLGAEVIFRTLLQHAGHGGDRDPAYHALQVFTMVEHILPEPSATLYDEGGPSHWVTSIIPDVLDEIRLFLRLLDPENRGHFVKRLIRLDDDVIGIGAWLLIQELDDITKTIETLTCHSGVENAEIVLQYQVTLSLQFILDLATPSSSSSKWCLNTIAKTPDLSTALNACIMALFDGHYTSKSLQDLIAVLAPSSSYFNSDLQATILLAALRVSRQVDRPTTLLEASYRILGSLPLSSINLGSLRLEIGQTLSILASKELNSSTAEILLSILEWLPGTTDTQITTLCGIAPDVLSSFFSSLLASLPSDKRPALETVRSTLSIDEDEYLPPPTIALPRTLKLSIHDLDELMRQNIPTPATPPNGAKTPDILGLIISPPTALLRSQVPTTGLTKTYVNNDFRQLRQTPSSRQNTSRLPSMHGTFSFSFVTQEQS
ncbi:hypothetical protein D9615_000697 [Tricholomella constricta]|uniref:Virilizer N-terminal domain-containing protein n=1 Tax=Tricholomella constricta TaxID=117010 RepID=A0A8H5HRH1_9AGAR|nr:hypothetical protein D9615_000697 [Tricholomella constricta]